MSYRNGRRCTKLIIISISSLVHTFRFTYAAVDDDADAVADEVVDVAADCNWFVVDGGGCWLLPAGSFVAVLALQRGSSSFMILLLISLGGRVVEVDLF